jgi:hypothetical protein
MQKGISYMKPTFATRTRTHQMMTMLAVTLAFITFAAPACKKPSGSSPTATLQAFYEALRDRNVEAYKKTVSKNSLQMLEKMAKDMDKTLDEYIRLDIDKPTRALPDKVETRNEKIEGDKATLEVKNIEGGWNTIPFVKEDGQWKIALDEQ